MNKDKDVSSEEYQKLLDERDRYRLLLTQLREDYEAHLSSQTQRSTLLVSELQGPIADEVWGRVKQLVFGYKWWVLAVVFAFTLGGYLKIDQMINHQLVARIDNEMGATQKLLSNTYIENKVATQVELQKTLAETERQAKELQRMKNSVEEFEAKSKEVINLSAEEVEKVMERYEFLKNSNLPEFEDLVGRVEAFQVALLERISVLEKADLLKRVEKLEAELGS